LVAHDFLGQDLADEKLFAEHSVTELITICQDLLAKYSEVVLAFRVLEKAPVASKIKFAEHQRRVEALESEVAETEKCRSQYRPKGNGSPQ
jgi:hypothetical protein